MGASGRTCGFSVWNVINAAADWLENEYGTSRLPFRTPEDLQRTFKLMAFFVVLSVSVAEKWLKKKKKKGAGF